MLLSVIIPAYNAAPWLRRAVESALRFRSPSVEVVVVDDGSTDTTPNLCAELMAESPQVRVVRQANGGLSSARNCGADHATGTHLLFLDADDELIPPEQPISWDLAADMVALGVEEIDRRGSSKLHLPVVAEPMVSGREHLRHSFRNGRFFTPSTAYIYRTTWYRSCGLRFKPGLLHEDMLFTPQALLSCEALAVVRQPVYRYIRREDSITGSPDPRKVKRRVAALAEVSRELTVLANQYPDVDIGWWTLHVMAYAGDLADSALSLGAAQAVLRMELRFLLRNRVWAPYRRRRDVQFRIRTGLARTWAAASGVRER
ncbi:MAG: glycosyltransferase [Hydrogenophaga sp.]|jgi:glycosyltransferase involved in cell wall biosynthesis|nr:glycosyltransferase [Hydrogenophaga sp.]